MPRGEEKLLMSKARSTTAETIHRLPSSGDCDWRLGRFYRKPTPRWQRPLSLNPSMHRASGSLLSADGSRARVGGYEPPWAALFDLGCFPLPQQRGGVFLGMGKSIDPMYTPRRTKGSGLPTPLPIVSMSFQSVIPRSGCSPAEPACASPTSSNFPLVRDACQCRLRCRPPPRRA